MLQLMPSTLLLLYIVSILAIILKFSLHIPLNNSYAWSKSILISIVYSSLISIAGGDYSTMLLTNYFPVLFITYITIYIFFEGNCDDEEQRLRENNDSSIFIVNTFVIILLIIHVCFLIYYLYSNYKLLHI